MSTKRLEPVWMSYGLISLLKGDRWLHVLSHWLPDGPKTWLTVLCSIPLCMCLSLNLAVSRSLVLSLCCSRTVVRCSNTAPSLFVNAREIQTEKRKETGRDKQTDGQRQETNWQRQRSKGWLWIRLLSGSYLSNGAVSKHSINVSENFNSLAHPSPCSVIHLWPAFIRRQFFPPPTPPPRIPVPPSPASTHLLTGSPLTTVWVK